MEVIENFGDYIRERRLSKNIKLRDLAAALGISAAYLSAIEKGERQAPSYDVQIKLAECLQFTQEQTQMMFDLAASTKREGTLPLDVAKFLKSDEYLVLFLREALNLGLDGKKLLKLLTNIQITGSK